YLAGGNGAAGVTTGGGGGATALAASAALSAAIGAAGAWIVLGLMLVVGLLLYFNMTIGDLVAAWLQRREERAELAQIESRRAADPRARPEPAPLAVAPGQRGLLGRMRTAFGVGGDSDEEPLILRRARPPESAAVPAARPREVPFAIGEVEPAQAIPVTVAELENEETAHLAEVE